ncbi:MAG: hypothetical protein F7B59_03220 [Desulfurococcales archaeon]|nr:hypothetical protein [Desulfurococcales archaeon]
MPENDSGNGEELGELVKALKDAIVELKSIVMEAESPYREKPPAIKSVKISNVSEPTEEAREAVHVKPQSVAEVLASQSREKHSGGIAAGIPAKIPPSVDEAKEKIEEALSSKGSSLRELSFRRILKLTRIFFNINKPVLQDNLSKIIHMLELTGYVNEAESELLKLLADLAMDSRKFKVRPEDNVIIAYMIARTLGVEDKEFESDLLEVLYNIAMSGRGEGVGEWASQQ